MFSFRLIMTIYQQITTEVTECSKPSCTCHTLNMFDPTCHSFYYFRGGDTRQEAIGVDLIPEYQFVCLFLFILYWTNTLVKPTN